MKINLKNKKLEIIARVDMTSFDDTEYTLKITRSDVAKFQDLYNNTDINSGTMTDDEVLKDIAEIIAKGNEDRFVSDMKEMEDGFFTLTEILSELMKGISKNMIEKIDKNFINSPYSQATR